MTVEITDGGADDLDEVMRIMGAAFAARYGEAWTRSQCAGILPMTGVKLAIARDGTGKAAGFALFRTIVDDAELLLIAVDPAAQGRGIGRDLLAHFVADARASGAERIHLEVRDGNPAIEIYKSAGFEQANRRRNYYRGRGGGEFDALTFVLARGK